VADAFGKFRNLYLIIENITSQIMDQVEPRPSKELPQLERALGICFMNKQASLENAANQDPDFERSGNIIADAAKYLYIAHRCELNHSKASSDHKVPFNEADEQSVKKAMKIAEFVAVTFMQYEEENFVR